MKLCPTHTREADEWVQCVQDLAQHPTMRPLDNGRHTDRTPGRNATTVVREQVGIIHQHCQQRRGVRGMNLTIDIPGTEWLSANQRLHWAAKAKRTRALRSRAAWLARQAHLKVKTPTIAVVEVSYPRNGTADTDNAQPTWKAVCDGLVDAGALPADDSNHLAAVSFRRGPKTGEKGLYRLTLTFVSQHVPF